jgi:CheY-like chemotaxis protein
MRLTSDRGATRGFVTPQLADLRRPSTHPADRIEIEDRRPVLLLVEDHDSTLSALRRLFTRLGWDVRSAITVSEALTLLTLEPEWIVLDLMLPDGDGLAVLREARSAGSSAKVVVTTGIEDPRRLEDARRHLPDAFLRKPMEFGELLRALNLRHEE